MSLSSAPPSVENPSPEFVRLDPERQAREVFEISVRQAVAGGKRATMSEITSVIYARMDELPVSQEARQTIVQQAQDVRADLRNVNYISVLEDGVAGQYGSGVITVDAGTVLGESSLSTKKVAEHEDYHRKKKHDEVLSAGDSVDGTSIVHIGAGPDSGFTQTGLVEAITLIDTNTVDGSSAEYHEHVRRLLSAVGSSDVTLGEVRTAVNETKDLTSIDYVSQGMGDFETERSSTFTVDTSQPPPVEEPASGRSQEAPQPSWAPQVVGPENPQPRTAKRNRRRRAAISGGVLAA